VTDGKKKTIRKLCQASMDFSLGGVLAGLGSFMIGPLISHFIWRLLLLSFR